VYKRQTEDYLRTYDLLPEETTKTRVFIPLLDPNLYTYIQNVAKQLRDSDINVEVQLGATKLGNQLKYASKKNIPWVIIIGDEEKATKQMQLKNMVSGEQSLVSLDEAINTLKL
jgi:histidyl-tRNA synthetase